MLDPGDLSRYAVLWHEKAPQRSEIDWSIRDDLAVRAHLALEEHVGRPLPVQMKLDKRIPVGGGLGGGSSNAAAMLRAVDTLHGLKMSDQALTDIASTLGSDVPFFLHGGSALVEGTGASIQPHGTCPKFHAVLVFPKISCPTGAVYRAFDESSSVPFRCEQVESMVSPTPDAQAFFNDLAAPAMSVAPELAEVHDRVAAVAEVPIHVSGSGSTLFIPCSDALHAGALAAAVHEQLDLPAVAVTTCERQPELLETIQ